MEAIRALLERWRPTWDAWRRLAPIADVLLVIPLRETARIQEVHLVTYHAICAALDERIAQT
jgi:hypothetical protein